MRAARARGPKGDRIAIWAPEATEWTLVQLAAARAGAVLVSLEGEWTAEQLGAALCEANARLLVTAGSERVTQLAAVRSELAALERLVTIDGLPCGGIDDLTWSELLVAGQRSTRSELAEREATLHPDDPVSIEYEQLAGGELRSTTLTHRDYLAVAGE